MANTEIPREKILKQKIMDGRARDYLRFIDKVSIEWYFREFLPRFSSIPIDKAKFFPDAGVFANDADIIVANLPKNVIVALNQPYSSCWYVPNCTLKEEQQLATMILGTEQNGQINWKSRILLSPEKFVTVPPNTIQALVNTGETAFNASLITIPTNHQLQPTQYTLSPEDELYLRRVADFNNSM